MIRSIFSHFKPNRGPWARSLEGRIVLFFVGLLLLIQACAYFALVHVRAGILRTEVEREQDAGARIFKRLMQEQRAQLEQAALVLASDAGFRDAVLSTDRATIESVLLNHGQRIGASIMQLVGVEGELLAHSPAPTGRSSAGFDEQRASDQFARLLERARVAGKASSAETLRDGRLYQVIVAPVMAPDLSAWIVIGFRLDEARVRDFEAMTELRVAYWSRPEAAEERLTLLATTFEASAHESLHQAVLAASPDGSVRGSAATLARDIGSAQFHTRIVPLSEEPTPRVIASLHRSIEGSLQGYRSLGAVLIALGALGIGLFGAGSWFIARQIIRPVNELAALADRIKAGDYSSTTPVASASEIGRLAANLDHMRVAIAEREERITKLAFYDPLTGLVNRTYLMDRLQHALERARTSEAFVAIMIIGLDRFKSVNEALGHGHGDRVLREVVQRIAPLVGESGTFARLGGDEFALLLPGMAADDALSLHGVMAQSLAVPIAVDEYSIDVAISVGVAIYPEHGADAPTLLREADIAMHAAKRARAGVTVFDRSRMRTHESQLSILSDIRRAIDANELVLHYQPKVDLHSGRLVAAEALVRWQHSKRGLVPPNDFIPFLEQTGHIRELTDWVLREGIRQTAAWYASGRRLVVSVNVSVRDLLDTKLPIIVERQLEEFRLPASAFCLELTESAFMDNPETVLNTARRLHLIGLRLSIDDYGTGYSSLAYLQQLPVQELKIDRSFVMSMPRSRDNTKIVRSTIDLGLSLGLSVTAEGVEDAETLEALRAMGCNTAQGTLISKPLSAADFERWMDEQIVGRFAVPGAY